jgi:hypothetical protein
MGFSMVAASLLWGLLLPVRASPCFTPSSSSFNATEFSSFLTSFSGFLACVTPGSYTLAAPLAGWRAHLDLPPLSSLTVDFTGVDLTCADRRGGGLYLQNFNNVTLRGLTLRYATPPSNTAVILSVDRNAGTVVAMVEPGHPVEDFLAGTVASCNLFDPSSRLRVPLSSDIYLINSSTLPGGKTFLLTASPGMLVDVVPSQLLGCRVPGGQMTVLLDGAVNSKLENVAVFGGPAFGFLEAGGGGNTYTNISILLPPPPPGATTQPLLSTSADGFHSSGARTGPRISGADFSGMDDDGIAIHGVFLLVAAADAGSGRAWLVNLGSLEVGDKLLCYDKAFEPVPAPQPPSFEPAYFTVLAVAHAPKSFAPAFNVSKTMPSQLLPPPSGYLIVQLSPSLPPGLGFDYVCANANAVGDGFSIEDSRISNHRARGLLIKASHGRIRNVTITNSSLGGVIITPELYWREASYAHALTIHDSTITLTSSGMQSYGGIAIGAVAPGNVLAKGPGHSGIVVRNNTLVDCGYYPIWLNAAGNLSLINNTLVSPFHAPTPDLLPHCCMPLPSKQRIAVYAASVQGLTVSGNCVHPAPPGQSSLQYLLNVSEDSTGQWEGGVTLCAAQQQTEQTK